MHKMLCSVVLQLTLQFFFAVSTRRHSPHTWIWVKHPTRAVEKAIKGMLPKNRLGAQVASKLKVYAGPEHPHAAQAPTPYVFTQVSQVAK